MTDAAPGQDKDPKASWSWLGQVAALSAWGLAFAAAWLYLAGWSYAYGYFDRFGIPLLMVDLPKEHYLAYGALVLKQELWWAAVLVFLAIALWLLRRRFRERWVRLPGGPWRARLGAGLVVALFWLGHAAGADVARQNVVRQRTTDYAAYPRVQLWLKTTTGPRPDTAPAPTELAAGCYRLLLHSRDRLFLIRPVRGAPAAELPTVIVPWGDIAALRVLPDHTSCP